MNSHVPSIAHIVARSTSINASTPDTTPISASPTVTSGVTHARTSDSSSWSIAYDSAVTASITSARSTSACTRGSSDAGGTGNARKWPGPSTSRDSRRQRPDSRTR